MQNSTETDPQSAIALLRGRFGSGFDQTSLDVGFFPYFLENTCAGERLFVPMIYVKFTKENALPRYLWGVLSQTLKFAAEDGVTVFVQALEKRGPENRKKR